MGNLLTSLLNTSNALRVYSQALNVTQNNVVNASTAGYAKQTQALEAMPFDVSVGLPGGVAAGPTVSSRDGFAEQAVRDQQTALGLYQQKTDDLTPLETYFSLSNSSGIGPSISGLFQKFSQLSVSPNDTVARQSVLDQANTVAESFRTTAQGLASQGGNLDDATRSTIDSINHLAGVIAGVNAHNRVDPSGAVDAGVDAQLNSALEQLSQLTNITALQQPDGTVSVYLGGQAPLVVGGHAYDVQGDFSGARTALLSSTGADITQSITGGKLSALLQDKNDVLPSYMADLNTLAEGVTAQVNATLANGLDQNGAAPSTDLFTFDATNGAAFTLAVNPLTPDQIAAALPGAPGGNGNALALANLANTKTINGYTFAQFYGDLGGRLGRDLADAKDTQSTKEQLLTQAQAMREKASGVSLDEEAEHLVVFQRAYEATSKMLSVLNSLTETIMNVIS